jgi:hypothetical protein
MRPSNIGKIWKLWCNRVIIQVRGRSEQNKYHQQYNTYDNKTGKARSKSNGKDKLCMYYKKNNRIIDEVWYLKLQNKEKINCTYQLKIKSDGDVRLLLFPVIILITISNLSLVVMFLVVLNGNLIMHICFIFVVTNTGSFLMGLWRVEMLCVWETTTPTWDHGNWLYSYQDAWWHDTHIDWGKTHTSMPRDLISLNTFDVEGYKHSSSRGVLKVSKGCLIHMIGMICIRRSFCLFLEIALWLVLLLMLLFLMNIVNLISGICVSDIWVNMAWKNYKGENLLDGKNKSKLEFSEQCIFVSIRG